MLTAIQLDHHLCGVTHEVGNIVFDGHLPPEARAIEPVIAEFRPKDSFSFSGVSSKRARIRAEPGGNFPGWAFWLGHRYLRCGETPTPTLPRKRERELYLARGRNDRTRGIKGAHPKRGPFPLPLAGEG